MSYRSINQLSAEQRQALIRFAINEGRIWKVILTEAWRSGLYPRHVKANENDEAHLQQIRNQYGPSWLLKVTLFVDNSHRLSVA